MRSRIWRIYSQVDQQCIVQRRLFHDYFVSHLPSSSLHPDSRSTTPSDHKLPRDASTPHNEKAGSRAPTSIPPRRNQAIGQHTRETTVVRIPLKSAKHHYGASSLRGSRGYNEDKYQAGTIEIPAFAKRQPMNISGRRPPGSYEKEGRSAQSVIGDPQVFYFGVFDGHGGEECSNFLRDRLHTYLEDAAQKLQIQSSLGQEEASEAGSEITQQQQNAIDLQRTLVESWKETVGGYFKRFRPEYFTALSRSADTSTNDAVSPLSIEAMLAYAFLHADLDFTKAQAQKHSPSPAAEDPVLDDKPLNERDVLSDPLKPASQNLTAPIGGQTRFKGGSTASIALISTPTPTPFWNPISPSTIIAAHVGDTRILLCRVSDGHPLPLTSNHHPSQPVEATRLRRYAAAFVTDSFGEERVAGLANTRAFGDISSKRIGVSAEPEITHLQVSASEYSFLVLLSDGVSGVLSDQEIVDIVKEARTPEQAARDVTGFATMVGTEDADNATCLVVRLGGWERRMEGGGGSLGSREGRDWKKAEAENPRSRRQ